MGGSHPYKWKKKYCEQLTEHMSKGYSLEAFAGSIGVTRDCIYKWIDRHECFKEAFEIGKSKQHMFFEGMGIHGMTGKLKNFNASVYIFTMKNKLKWKDKIETELSSTDSGLRLSYTLNNDADAN